MSTPRIRLATPDDLDWLVATDASVPEEEQRRKIGESEILVAELDGERIGLLRLDFLWSKLAFVALVWVLEGHRRRGAGKAFLRFLDEHLARLGCKTLLSSSQADEASPQAWHRHMGFVECGILTGMDEHGVGEILFRRRLGDPLP